MEEGVTRGVSPRKLSELFRLIENGTVTENMLDEFLAQAKAQGRVAYKAKFEKLKQDTRTFGSAVAETFRNYFRGW